jgi:hypothetical protein
MGQLEGCQVRTRERAKVCRRNKGIEREVTDKTREHGFGRGEEPELAMGPEGAEVGESESRRNGLGADGKVGQRGRRVRRQRQRRLTHPSLRRCTRYGSARQGSALAGRGSGAGNGRPSPSRRRSPA